MALRSHALPFSSLVLSVSLLACLPVAAQNTPQVSLVAVSKHDHTLSTVDPATLKVIASVPIGEDPHEVAVSTDGKTAYVSILGGGNSHTNSVVDLVRQKALPDIDLGILASPHGLDFVGGKLWFTAETNKVFGSYDPAMLKVDWVMGTGQDRTHMIYASPDTQTFYISNVGSATLSIVEHKETGMPPPPANSMGAGAAPIPPPPTSLGQPQAGATPGRKDWVQTVVPVGHGAEGYDISPDRREIWTANS